MDEVKLFEATNEDEGALFEWMKLNNLRQRMRMKLNYLRQQKFQDAIKLFEATNVEKLRIKFIQAEILGKWYLVALLSLFILLPGYDSPCKSDL